MLSASSASSHRSPITPVLDFVEKAAFVFFGAAVLLDLMAFLSLPPLCASFWWAVALNVAGTFAVWIGLPLWDLIRRRVG